MPWDDIWINANLATMVASGEKYGALQNAVIAADSGRIAWIGPHGDLPDQPNVLARNVHDACARWITPGLIDCHTHIVYGGSRAHEFEMRLDGASYEEIARAGGGIVSTVRATRESGETEIAARSSARLETVIVEGVTTVEIKSGLRARYRHRNQAIAYRPGDRRARGGERTYDVSRRACLAARICRRTRYLYQLRL